MGFGDLGGERAQAMHFCVRGTVSSFTKNGNIVEDTVKKNIAGIFSFSGCSEALPRTNGHRIVHLEILTDVFLHIQIFCMSASELQYFFSDNSFLIILDCLNSHVQRRKPREFDCHLHMPKDILENPIGASPTPHHHLSARAGSCPASENPLAVFARKIGMRSTTDPSSHPQPNPSSHCVPDSQRARHTTPLPVSPLSLNVLNIFKIH